MQKCSQKADKEEKHLPHSPAKKEDNIWTKVNFKVILFSTTFIDRKLYFNISNSPALFTQVSPEVVNKVSWKYIPPHPTAMRSE